MNRRMFLRRLRGGAVAITSPTPTPTPTPTPAAFSISKTSAETQTRYAQLTAPFAGKWAGYQSEAFSTDVAVATNAAFTTAYTNAKNAAANGVWHRIRVQAGVTAMALSDADFRPRNGGGLLIERDWEAGHDPAITGAVGSGCPRGLQIGRIVGVTRTGFLMCRQAASPFTYQDQLRINRPAGAIHAVLKVQGNRMGINFPGASGYLENSENMAAYGIFNMRFFYCEEVQVVDNQFNGFEQGADFYGCYIVESARNDFQQNKADLMGYSAFAGTDERKGLFASDHSYHWFHHNTTRNILDWWGYAVPASGPHADLQQLKTTVRYPGSNLAMQLNRWVAVNGNYYKCVTAGTTGTNTPPSGTGAGIVDGTAVFDFVSSVAAGPATYLVSESNVVLDAESAYGDGATRYGMSMQLNINSDSTQRSGGVWVNNLQATRAQYGVQTGGSGVEFARVEYNTFGPTCEIMPAGGFTVAFGPSIFSNTEPFTPGVFYARRNVCAGFTPSATAVTEEENIIVDGRAGTASPNRPGDKLAGPFAQNPDGYWLMGYTDDGSVDRDTFIADMYARLKMADGSDYGAAF